MQCVFVPLKVIHIVDILGPRTPETSVSITDLCSRARLAFLLPYTHKRMTFAASPYRATSWLASILVLMLWVGCQSSSPTPDEGGADAMPDYDTAALARSMHAQVNDEREADGLAPLDWSDDLAALSRAHSQDMVRRDFFSHTNPDGQSPTDRGEAMDVQCATVVGNQQAHGIAENIYDASAYHTRRTTTQGDETSVTYDWKTADELSETVVQGWMDSPGHRRNILDDTYEAQGLGVAVSDDLRVLVTQTFC